MTGILDEITANKRREVHARETELPLGAVRKKAEMAAAARALSMPTGFGIIAEMKRRSPSAGLIREIEPAQQARLYSAGGAAGISVLTDQTYFGGSFDDLQAIRQVTEIPILCKDFILTEYQVHEARSYGADLVLLIVAALPDSELHRLQRLVLDLGMTPLVEVHDQHDLARAIALDAAVIGINNRDLRDFSVDLVTTEYLAPFVPDDVLLISESGIATREDVARVRAAGAHAALIGEGLLRADDPVQLLRELAA